MFQLKKLLSNEQLRLLILDGMEFHYIEGSEGSLCCYN